MQVRIIQLGTKNRAATIALATMALAVGGVLLAFGFVLLLSLAAVATAVGAGLLLRRAVRRALGRAPAARLEPMAEPTLDPAMRVFPRDDAGQAGDDRARLAP